MGEYKDVAQNSDILKIANAIRLVTGYEGDMKIEQMPRIILESGLAVNVHTKIVDIHVDSIAVDSPVLVDTISDSHLKHLFLVMPARKQDIDALKKWGPEQVMLYDSATGQLKIVFARNRLNDEDDIKLIVVHILLEAELENGAFYLGQTLDPVSLVKLDGIEVEADKTVVKVAVDQGADLRAMFSSYMSRANRKNYEVVQFCVDYGTPVLPSLQPVEVFVCTYDEGAETPEQLAQDLKTGKVYQILSRNGDYKLVDQNIECFDLGTVNAYEYTTDWLIGKVAENFDELKDSQRVRIYLFDDLDLARVTKETKEFKILKTMYNEYGVTTYVCDLMYDEYTIYRINLYKETSSSENYSYSYSELRTQLKKDLDNIQASITGALTEDY